MNRILIFKSIYDSLSSLFTILFLLNAKTNVSSLWMSIYF